jgi:D-psicose/D-tagatose/L-ribulose 3-epimerase
MKLAISNIAWPVERDSEAAELFLEAGVEGIEIAPTKIWPEPLRTTSTQILEYRQFWESRGLPIIAAQALLFGQPTLTIFDSPTTREVTITYLQGIIRLCAELGAQSLVFGSPKNRRIGSQPREAVWPIAVDFFAQLGEFAKSVGTTLVLEANPTDYGADFITRGQDALELVEAVNSPGFRLHLDTACMSLANDNAVSLIPKALLLLQHFHASEPHLAPIGQGGIDHVAVGKILHEVGYAGWVSVEMRQPEPFHWETLRNAINCAASAYRK